MDIKERTDAVTSPVQVIEPAQQTFTPQVRLMM